MDTKIDIALINSGDKRQIYQELGNEIAAIEPPYLIAAIAEYLRKKGFLVTIVDANAENYSPEETASKVKEINPLLATVIVYGSQPSASTQNMTAAEKICKALKENTTTKVAIGGLHPSALPKQTLEESKTDFVIEGEGFYTLEKLIKVIKDRDNDFSEIPGLWYRSNGTIRNNPKALIVNNLNEVLSISDWDLLPMKKYRAHNWHCFDNLDRRIPYGAIYTSFGCPYNCVFCCINAPFGKPGIRYRNPEFVVEEIGFLVKKYEVRNLKIADELFVLNENHYMKIVELLIKNKYDLNIWAYARVDTVKAENLNEMKKAGINWLALGIESGNPDVRDGASKKLRIKDITNIIKSVQNSGINVLGNYIFGLPDDTVETMQETLDMAIEQKCEFVNFYAAMAYPGSKLYDIAIKQGWKLPKEWHGFSQHAYETLPLPTKYISAKEVLGFRDNAFHKYFENIAYLDMIEKKFGLRVRQHIVSITKTRLRRKILEQ